VVSDVSPGAVVRRLRAEAREAQPQGHSGPARGGRLRVARLRAEAAGGVVHGAGRGGDGRLGRVEDRLDPADPSLKSFSRQVSDSGEGRWTIDAAIDEAVLTNVPAAALFERFSSRGRPSSRTGCSPSCAISSGATSKRHAIGERRRRPPVLRPHEAIGVTWTHPSFIARPSPSPQRGEGIAGGRSLSLSGRGLE
jgi:hypothetical protein